MENLLKQKDDSQLQSVRNEPLDYDVLY